MIEDCETVSPTELEELKTDAQRYRWLRNYRPGLILDMLEDDEITNEQWSLDLDQAIDAAMLLPDASEGARKE